MGSINERVGARIREIRVAKGLSQLDVALKMRTTATQVSYMENGRISMKLSTLVRIAHVLGVSPDHLLRAA